MIRLLFVFFLLTSCTHYDHDKTFMKPFDAQIYENEVKFNCDGKTITAVGQGVCQYPEGELVRLKVKVPPTHGTISASSCQKKEVLDFRRGANYVSLDWLMEGHSDSCPVIISVAGYDSGIQLFRFIPYVYNRKFEKLDKQYVDQLPVGAMFNIEVDVDPGQAGKILVSSVCDLTLPVQKITEFPEGTMSIRIKMQGQKDGFCPISYAIKYDNNNFTEGEIYLNFYNNKYIPLAKPSVGKKNKICRPYGTRYYEVDGRETKNCRSGNKAHSWTRIGRMSIYGN